jgi:hypothetical protein
MASEFECDVHPDPTRGPLLACTKGNCVFETIEPEDI